MYAGLVTGSIQQQKGFRRVRLLARYDNSYIEFSNQPE